MAHFPYSGNILMIGYGSVGRCTMPLIEKHFGLNTLSRVTVVDGHDHRADAQRFIDKGMTYLVQPIGPQNLEATLGKYCKKGDLILNLSVEVDSLEVIKWGQKNGVMYLDTCIEPWANYYDNTSIPEEQRTNYYLRHRALEARKSFPKNGPSALVTHGANPGLITHFIKQALLEIANLTGNDATKPTTREGWAKLMQKTGTKVIHVAEHDLQVTNVPKRPGEFCNTWSIPGFVGEGSQPAELGWGTHEKWMPENGRTHDKGCGAAIYLLQPGANTRVRTWCPTPGPQYGFLVTHNESISISDFFTLRGKKGKVQYRPTCHYAYHPCNDAVLSLHEMFGAAGKAQSVHHVLDENELVDGVDELGVLLYGHDKNAYWYGSQLSLAEARKLAPYQNATGMQVTSAVLAGMVWALENPEAGIVEADEMDYRRCLEVQSPYLGPVKGHYTDWTPLDNRPGLFPEDLDKNDPWQFRNILVR